MTVQYWNIKLNKFLVIFDNSCRPYQELERVYSKYLYTPFFMRRSLDQLFNLFVKGGGSKALLSAYLLLGLLLYFPILNNAFLSDDYDSLSRIVVEKKVLVKEFFRPMIDWTFYFNYMLSGMNPFSYYVFNLLVHIINAFLVSRLSLNLIEGLPRESREKVALLSGFLFLIYPFHNEAIVWLTGRLASLSCMFALLAANVLFCKIKNALKGLYFIVLYFAGLLAYESILLLPFILMCFWWRTSRSSVAMAKLLLSSMVLVAAYLLTRYMFSGAVYGDYGERMLTNDLSGAFFKTLKTFGRTVLPPVERSELMVTLFGVVLSALLWGGVQLFRKKNVPYRHHVFRVVAAFLLSMLIPSLFGVSTRTSEGDRLLYFPSVFLVILIAFVVMQVAQKIVRWTLICIVSLYFGAFLLVNNAQWEKASGASEAILASIIENKGTKSLVINLPDELEGAFVFRNGFYKAVHLHGVDTGRVIVNNYLNRLDYLGINGPIGIDSLHSYYFIAPVTRIISQEGIEETIKIENTVEGTIKTVNPNTDVLFFWNKFEFKKIQ